MINNELKGSLGTTLGLSTGAFIAAGMAWCSFFGLYVCDKLDQTVH